MSWVISAILTDTYLFCLFVTYHPLILQTIPTVSESARARRRKKTPHTKESKNQIYIQRTSPKK